MEISVTVSRQEIIDALVSEWYNKKSVLIDAIKSVDLDIADWDFTIKMWAYFDRAVQEGLKEDNDGYIKEAVSKVKGLP